MIEDYNFVKYDVEFMDHLARHIRGSETVGSTFRGELDPKDIVDYAFEKIRRPYSGEKKAFEISVPFAVGYDGVIHLSKVPRGIEVRKLVRDGRHEVNVVSGIRKIPTRNLVVVAGPMEGTEKHGFLSIYPGQACPPMENREFWERHAFIDDSTQESR